MSALTFYVIFTLGMLAPLLAMDLIFDDKERLFLMVDPPIIAGALLTFVVWGIWIFAINKRYRVVSR